MSEADKALADAANRAAAKQADAQAHARSQGVDPGPWGVDLRTGRAATSPPAGANIVDTSPALPPSRIPAGTTSPQIGTRNEGIIPRK